MCPGIRVFWLDVLAQTTPHVVVMQDGARYHPSKARQQFFATHAELIAKLYLTVYSTDELKLQKLT
jgi:hypothetical protein